MILCNHIEQMPLKNPIALAVGFFDGIHRGHQAVLATAIQAAKDLEGEAWALTFDPHPLKVIRPQAAPLLLTTTQQKVRLLEQTGLDGCFMLRFDQKLRETAGVDFIERLHNGIPALRHIIAGMNFHFGHHRDGNPDMLACWAAERGIQTTIVKPVEFEHGMISSTAIRHAVSEGDMREAYRMLGRPYQLTGRIIHGHHMGRTLGYPTGNIQTDNELLPPHGVYAATLHALNKEYPAAAYIGSRPTMNQDRAVSFEVHALNQTLDLYGQEVLVDIVDRIRPDKQFSSVEQLQAQIALDIKRINEILRTSFDT